MAHIVQGVADLFLKYLKSGGTLAKQALRSELMRFPEKRGVVFK